MALPPTFAALRKHKTGVILIASQVALTLAIVCNVAFIVSLHLKRIDRPTGLIEDQLFLINQRYINAPAGEDDRATDTLDAMQRADLAQLRGLKDVAFATPVVSLPLLHNHWSSTLALKPDDLHSQATVNTFAGGEDALQTLGLALVAGRDFRATEFVRSASTSTMNAPAVLITQSLADKLFPGGNGVGQPVYLNGSMRPSVIVGVLARLLTSDSGGHEATAWDSVLLPVRMDTPSTMYAVRAKPGRLDAAMAEASKALFEIEPLRVMDPGGRYTLGGVEPFVRIRNLAYARDEFMAQVLLAVCAIVLVTTSFGITGLTSFWVSQRTRHIGIRRALGARKRDILHYFHMENLFIVGGGCVTGAVLATALNVALMHSFELSWMPPIYTFAGVLLVLLLGQLAVFIPARRASRIAPLAALRAS
ncbi:ABC transporter permease [Luteibacter aegosomaticola]|uniref:ABC transporter permease n=1 Tax=Luteibacter aegosomaticola TaxID=2911538 RepID=UPI001FF98456|nr:FtsX-like permease family protein [Luteibacter aegosomaticola]UPG89978.1 ABC transporter permease [Luteibacter aegosomaticola]